MRWTRVSVAIHPDDATGVALSLSRVEGLRLSEPKQGERVAEREVIEGLERARNRLRSMLHELGIDERDGGQPTETRPREDAAGIENLLGRAESELEDWRCRRDRLEGDVERLSWTIRETERVTRHGICIEELEQLHHVRVFFGHIPWDPRHRVAVRAPNAPVVVLVLEVVGAQALVVAAGLRKPRFVLDRVLESLSFRPLKTVTEGRVHEDRLYRDRRRLGELRSELLRVVEERDELVGRWAAPLQAAHVQVLGDLGTLRVMDRYARSGPCYLLTGSLPEDRSEGLLALIHRAAKRPHTVLLTPSTEAG